MLTLEMLERWLAAGGILVAVCFIGLGLLRLSINERSREVENAARMVEPVLHSWLVLGTDVEVLRLTMRGMRSHAALRSLCRLVAQQVPFEQQQQLAVALRGEPWVERILKQSSSMFWWQRFDAARLLSVVGTRDDEAVIGALLNDKSAAVRLVAIDAAARLQGRELVDRELETLPERQDAVQAYQISAMARQPLIVAPALIPRLSAEAATGNLIAWIDTAAALALGEALLQVRQLSTHQSVEVRVHVARALRRLSDPDTPAVLIQLLNDSDWRVRAQAARALGALRCGAAIDALGLAVRDRSWWVRYRSALALAQIAGRARVVLMELTRCDDSMARDMATLVAGLSSAAVVEMSEV